MIETYSMLETYEALLLLTANPELAEESGVDHVASWVNGLETGTDILHESGCISASQRKTVEDLSKILLDSIEQENY